MPNALIAHPIVFSAASYVLRVTIGTVTENLTFSATPGRYYWLTGDNQADASTNGGVGDLLRNLQTCIASHSDVGTITVSLTSGFRVQVVTSSIATINILWGDAATTLDATIFGWAQTDTAGTGATLTAPNLGRGLWRAGKPISEPDTRRRRVHLGGISESLSGLHRVSNFGVSVRQRELAFRLLQRSVALDEYATTTEPYGTWEQAWESMRLGRPARIYADETSRTSTSYSLVRTRSVSDPLARDPSTPLRWGVDLQVADL
jgi:hypothetical protein